MIVKPQPGAYPPFAEGYVKLAIGFNDVIDALSTQQQKIAQLFTELYAAKGNYSYAEGKWTLKDVLQHMIDTERIFSYRALCVARGEQQTLPGFDQDEYALASGANLREMTDLLEEYKMVRSASIWLLRSFTTEQAGRVGTANGSPVSANGLAYMIVGHELHHINILKERYV